MSQFSPTPEVEGQVSDAVSGNWVDLLAPRFSRPYLRLSRADRPIGTWLLLLPCWWGLGLAILADGQFALHDVWIFVSCAIGAFLMRGAGCTWNDITDRKIDGAVERTRSRPIPSGQVTVTQAIIWMILQAGIAALILFSYNVQAIILGFASLALVAIYPFAKRFTWWPQAFLGLAFNWGALMIYVAHSGVLRIEAVLLYAAGIIWTLFYDTIYAHQDREDDALIGVKSTARLFADRTPTWLFAFSILSAILLGIATYLACGERGTLSTLIAMLALPAFWIHLRWQMGRFDANDPIRLMMLFRSNRDAGLIVVLFFAIAAML
ncbi:4-hydroxybenzoate polyprenyltransferase [Rhodobacteraceae bacterium HIMB11]|nr:4-hydroxybenzoate polyprenyltransferase [Rhodobacteraceae bacterium HIMB11]